MSCLINYTKEKNKDKWKKTWNGLAKYTRGNRLFKETSLGKKLILFDSIWVNKLNEYRADLIHYEADNLPSSATHNLMNDTINVEVLAPEKLKKHFNNLSKSQGVKDYSVNSLSLWLIDSSLNIITEIQEELKNYINEIRILTDEEAVYKFKNAP